MSLGKLAAMSACQSGMNNLIKHGTIRKAWHSRETDAQDKTWFIEKWIRHTFHVEFYGKRSEQYHNAALKALETYKAKGVPVNGYIKDTYQCGCHICTSNLMYEVRLGMETFGFTDDEIDEAIDVPFLACFDIDAMCKELGLNPDEVITDARS